jgi:tetratricopeptide (TPR) repeat protein
MKGLSSWDLLERGQFNLAYSQMTKDINEKPDTAIHHLANRGLCLLLLGRPSEALADFRMLLGIHPESSTGYIFAGISQWWLGQPLESVAMWEEAVNAELTDAAGGVQSPALLYFAATHLRDSCLEKHSIELLKRRLRSKRIKAWPGPIAEFLLGKLDKTEFLHKSAAVDNPILEKRRLTKAHFWIGFRYYRQGNTNEYKSYLQKSLAGHILEPEYYLASYELLNIDDPSPS